MVPGQQFDWRDVVRVHLFLDAIKSENITLDWRHLVPVNGSD
jgi:hypothetical protein